MLISKFKTYSLLFFLMLIATGCHNTPSPDYGTRVNKVPAFLVDHFPSKLTDSIQSSLITNTDTTSQCIYYFLVQHGENISQKLNTSNFGKSIIGKYSAADTNIISIKRETVTYWNPEQKRYYTDTLINNKNYFPIPYFESQDLLSTNGNVKGVYSDQTNSGLSDAFIVYVYDFQAGKFWDGLKPLDYMPNGWKNGYSKGVALNKSKNVIIYWFVVW